MPDADWEKLKACPNDISWVHHRAYDFLDMDKLRRNTAAIKAKLAAMEAQKGQGTKAEQAEPATPKENVGLQGLQSGV